MPTWSALLLTATALHAGFQATVTVLVYPALSRVGPADWGREHRAHSRRIVPLVGVVYGFLAVTCLGALLSLPASPALWVALLGTLGAVLVTALGAAPTHGRLEDGPAPALVGRLLVLDRWRLAGALVALGGALAQALA